MYNLFLLFFILQIRIKQFHSDLVSINPMPLSTKPLSRFFFISTYPITLSCKKSTNASLRLNLPKLNNEFQEYMPQHCLYPNSPQGFIHYLQCAVSCIFQTITCLYLLAALLNTSFLKLPTKLGKHY